MGPVGYVIAILGCTDGASACQTAATLSTRYESAAQCAAAREGALDSSTDLDFPTIIAECRRSGANPAEARAPASDEERGTAA